MKLNDLIPYVLKKYPDKYISEDISILIKIIYLVEWKHCIEYGKQLTDMQWHYTNHGPLTNELDELIFNILDIPKTKIKPTKLEKKIIKFVIAKTKKMSYTTFNNLIYSTYPMFVKERGDGLNLVELAKEYEEYKKE